MAEAKTGTRKQSAGLMQTFLPGTLAASRDVDQRIKEALAQGDTPRALGASAGQIVRAPVALVDDVVGRPVRSLLAGVPAFVGGLTGSRGSVAVPKESGSSKLRAKFADLTPSQNVRKNAGVLKTVEPEKKLTPQEKQLAFLDNVFGGALTLNQATAATAMLPAPPKAQSEKDKTQGLMNQTAQALYSEAVKQATALEATDPEGARALAAKATDEYFQRLATTMGFNPLNLGMAQMLPDGEE